MEIKKFKKSGLLELLRLIADMAGTLVVKDGDISLMDASQICLIKTHIPEMDGVRGNIELDEGHGLLSREDSKGGGIASYWFDGESFYVEYKHSGSGFIDTRTFPCNSIDIIAKEPSIDYAQEDATVAEFDSEYLRLVMEKMTLPHITIRTEKDMIEFIASGGNMEQKFRLPHGDVKEGISAIFWRDALEWIVQVLHGPVKISLRTDAPIKIEGRIGGIGVVWYQAPRIEGDIKVKHWKKKA